MRPSSCSGILRRPARSRSAARPMRRRCRRGAEFDGRSAAVGLATISRPVTSPWRSSSAPSSRTRVAQRVDLAAGCRRCSEIARRTRLGRMRVALPADRAQAVLDIGARLLRSDQRAQMVARRSRAGAVARAPCRRAWRGIRAGRAGRSAAGAFSSIWKFDSMRSSSSARARQVLRLVDDQQARACRRRGASSHRNCSSGEQRRPCRRPHLAGRSCRHAHAQQVVVRRPAW